MNKISPVGRRLGLGIVLTSATLLLPAFALAASTVTTARSADTGSAAAAAAPRCGNAVPAYPGGAFVWAATPGNGSMGQIDYEVEVSNVGRHPCTLRGIPGLAAALGNGHLVGGRVPASGKGPLITLEPYATAHFHLTVHDGYDLCAHPVGTSVVVYLPGQRQGQTVYVGAEACAGHPGGGVLSAEALKSGAGIPFYDN
jgi:hypothetical protein